MENGFISLDRKIMEWEWYQDVNTKAVFIHCLLKANWKDGIFMGKVIHRGSFVTSRKTLAKELKLGEQTIRTCLEHLKSTNEITIEPTNKYSVITIVKYDDYQNPNRELTNNLTNNLTLNQPTKPENLTTIEQYNKYLRLIDRCNMPDFEVDERLMNTPSDRPLRIGVVNE